MWLRGVGWGGERLQPLALVPPFSPHPTSVPLYEGPMLRPFDPAKQSAPPWRGMGPVARAPASRANLVREPCSSRKPCCVWKGGNHLPFTESKQFLIILNRLTLGLYFVQRGRIDQKQNPMKRSWYHSWSSSKTASREAEPWVQIPPPPLISYGPWAMYWPHQPSVSASVKWRRCIHIPFRVTGE